MNVNNFKKFLDGITQNSPDDFRRFGQHALKLWVIGGRGSAAFLRTLGNVFNSHGSRINPDSIGNHSPPEGS